MVVYGSVPAGTGSARLFCGRFDMKRDREVFMAWITKYALTEGILKMQVEDCFNISPDMVKVNGPLNHFHGKDWHRTHEAAIRRAKEMQAAKLKSIDKQRARIAALRFE